MSWRDRLAPARMCRVTIVAPHSRWRTVMVQTAELGVFEPDEPDAASGGVPGPATALVDKLRPAGTGCLAFDPVKPDQLAEAHEYDVLLGEADLERRSAAAVNTESYSVLAGWIPSNDVARLRERLEPLGASLVELPLPAGVSPPSMLSSFAGKSGRLLVDTYSTVAYNDVDPAAFATVAYVVMFGMMFGDVGHGAILALIALAARRTDRQSLQALRRVWVIIFWAGVAAMVFGVLYGEAFGPTELVPVVWLEPLAEPNRLLVAGVVLGVLLMAVTYVLASIDRWREGGLPRALYSASGLAGAFVFAGVAAVAGGAVSGKRLVWQAGVALVCIGLVLTVVGMVAELGHTAGALLQVGIEIFDMILRLGSNLVSFARLAAFGLTHAAISKVVWDATVSFWGTPLGSVSAVVLFVFGNAIAFALETLVAGIQALRLEYYELFSRLFMGEGEAFIPWHVDVRRRMEST